MYPRRTGFETSISHPEYPIGGGSRDGKALVCENDEEENWTCVLVRIPAQVVRGNVVISLHFTMP